MSLASSRHPSKKSCDEAKMIAPTHGGEDNVILISPPLEPSDDYYQLSEWANRVEFSDLRLTDESIIGVPLEITSIY